MSEPRLVSVAWRDAWFDLDPDASSWEDACRVATVGWLVRETADSIVLAAEWTERGSAGRTWRAVTSVPRCLVVSLVHLVEEGPR